MILNHLVIICGIFINIFIIQKIINKILVGVNTIENNLGNSKLKM